MSLPLQKALEGKYEILDKIAEGGIGSIYRVRHTLLDEIRVVKVLRPHLAEKEDIQARFVHEAKTAILFRHPNVAQIYDFAAASGTAYIVMEYIDGVALDAMVTGSGVASLELALEIGRQGLNALGYLHDSGFIHRDVSPDNLMFTKSLDGSPLVKLIDLGIAKNLAADSQLTATGMFLGKVRYCSPEQFSSGATGLDQRSDIYSYGILLYELLTGRFPIRGESFGELASGHIVRPPYPFEETDPEGRIPEGLRQVVLKALEKKPEQRYQSVAELSEALAAFQQGPVPPEEVDRVLGAGRGRLARDGMGRRGSTQERLDREFRREPTPRPEPPPEPLAEAPRAEGAGLPAAKPPATGPAPDGAKKTFQLDRPPESPTEAPRPAAAEGSAAAAAPSETQATVDIVAPPEGEPAQTEPAEPKPPPPPPPSAATPPRRPGAPSGPIGEAGLPDPPAAPPVVDNSTVLVSIDRIRPPSHTIAAQADEPSDAAVESPAEPPATAPAAPTAAASDRTAETDLSAVERLPILFVAVRDLLDLGNAGGALDRLDEVRELAPGHPSLAALVAEAEVMAADGTETSD